MKNTLNEILNQTKKGAQVLNDYIDSDNNSETIKVTKDDVPTSKDDKGTKSQNETNQKQTTTEEIKEEKEKETEKKEEKEVTNSGVEINKTDLPKKPFKIKKGSKKDTKKQSQSNASSTNKEDKSSDENNTSNEEKTSKDNTSKEDKNFDENKFSKEDNTSKSKKSSKVYKNRTRKNVSINSLLKKVSLLLSIMMILIAFVSLTNKTPVIDTNNSNPHVSEFIDFVSGLISGDKLKEDASKNGLSLNNLLSKVPSLPVSKQKDNTKKTEKESNTFSISALKSLNENKPANYYSLLENYKLALLDNKEYENAKKTDNVILLDKIFFELNKSSSPKYKEGGNEFILNGCFNGFAIYTNKQNAKIINKKRKEIVISIESAYYQKKVSDVSNKKDVENFVSLLIERSTGIKPTKVVRYVFLKNS